MCQRLKTREEIASQVYLNQADIKKLLDVSRDTAKRIYMYAKQIDEDELRFIIEPTKVRIVSVCKATGMTLATIQRQATLKNGSA